VTFVCDEQMALMRQFNARTRFIIPQALSDIIDKCHFAISPNLVQRLSRQLRCALKKDLPKWSRRRMSLQ
jgi:hypothetical protein